MELSKITVSETFTVAGIEFIKCSEKDGKVFAVTKNKIFDMTFGKNNNFAESDILVRLNDEILPKLIAEVGDENIKAFELDLTSLDGLDTYGKITTKIGLPTIDFYRENVKIFDNHKLDEWWWLATPDSTPEHHCYRWVLCVSPSGYVINDGYYGNCGVRPFCIFKSSISVSCEE